MLNVESYSILAFRSLKNTFHTDIFVALVYLAPALPVQPWPPSLAADMVAHRDTRTQLELEI